MSMTWLAGGWRSAPAPKRARPMRRRCETADARSGLPLRPPPDPGAADQRGGQGDERPGKGRGQKAKHGAERKGRKRRRSEEHTSELQSIMSTSYADLRLKKKNTT